jgi:hypothetical protein
VESISLNAYNINLKFTKWIAIKLLEERLIWKQKKEIGKDVRRTS